jgi:hypothetical protein
VTTTASYYKEADIVPIDLGETGSFPRYLFLADAGAHNIGCHSLNDEYFRSVVL